MLHAVSWACVHCNSPVQSHEEILSETVCFWWLGFMFCLPLFFIYFMVSVYFSFSMCNIMITQGVSQKGNLALCTIWTHILKTLHHSPTALVLTGNLCINCFSMWNSSVTSSVCVTACLITWALVQRIWNSQEVMHIRISGTSHIGLLHVDDLLLFLITIILLFQMFWISLETWYEFLVYHITLVDGLFMLLGNCCICSYYWTNWNNK